MKIYRLLFLVLIFCSVEPLCAKGRYFSRLTDAGTMYFFMPAKLATESKDKLVFDMTLLSKVDSIAINMTMTSNANIVKSVTIKTDDLVYKTNDIEIFYMDRNKSRWDTRIHINCPIDKFEKFYQSAAPMKIEIEHNNGSSVFYYTKSNWKKDVLDVADVFRMIRILK